MSLNGLDDPVVQEAYQAAVAEAGGWLLLKYISRDSVDLFSRGKGGLQEARASITKYEEASPLYGMVVYRRRKVLIKYIPEGTSRVLQARTAVHFQDVVEKFSPYETLLEISTSEGLNDASLAASFPLHTATPSASSSRLDEITEDAEDPGPAKSTPLAHTPNGSYFPSQRRRVDRQRSLATSSPTQSVESGKDANRPTSPSSYTSPVKTSVSQFLVRSDSGQPSITSLGTTSMTSMTGYTTSEASAKDTQSSLGTAESLSGMTNTTTLARSEFPPEEPEPSAPEIPERTSSRGNSSRGDVAVSRQPNVLPQSSPEPPTSPTAARFSEQINYEDDLPDFLKPKKKLGPRPVAASDRAKRPTVASISSMPAGYRPSLKKQEPPRPSSARSAAPASITTAKTLPTPPPIPVMPEYKPRPLSRGSVKSMPSHKSTAMTPDKIRLMKAVELRKKQMRKSNPQAETFVPPTDAEVAEIPNISEQPLTQQDERPSAREIEENLTPELTPIAKDEPLAPIPIPIPNHKADSGIQMDYQKEQKLEAPTNDIETQADEMKQTIPEPTPKTSEQSLRLSRKVSPQLNIPGSFMPEPTQRMSAQDLNLAREVSPQLYMPGSFLSDSTSDSETDDIVDNKYTKLAENDVTPKPAEKPVANESWIGDTRRDDAPAIPTIGTVAEPRPKTPSGTQQIPEEAKSLESDTESKSFYDSASTSGELDTFEMSPKRKNSDYARRRQGFVEPIQIDTDPEITTDDDDLMDELQSAVVEQATPVMVSKSSPVQEYFPRRPSAGVSDSGGTVREIRMATSPVSANESTPKAVARAETYEEISIPRSRGETSEKPDQPAGMKRNVSNEISKRIQALAGMSSTDNMSPSPEPFSNDFQRDQVASSRSAPHSRNSSWKAVSRYSSRTGLNQYPVSVSPPPQASSGPVYTVQRNTTGNRESVSVSARIVRPRISEETESNNTTETGFQESRYVINHKRGASSRNNIPPPLQQIDTSSDQSTSRGTSSPMPTSPTLTRPSKESHRVSQNKIGPLPTVEDFPQPPPSNCTVSNSPIGNDENAAPRESTRTSRFFKRMSNIGGKRRSGTQQVSETNLAAVIASAPSKETIAVSSMPPAVVLGDLNIQFPDSLLWKRRIVSITSDGDMKFSIPQASETQKTSSTRKFALSEFRMPFIPDLDRQELSNSIMLDFIDGGTTLQLACEDATTHGQVAQVLKGYWKAWTSPA